MKRLFLSVLFLSTLGCLLTTANLAAQSFSAQDIARLKSFYESGMERNGIVGSSLVLLHCDRIVFQDFYGRQAISPAQPVDDKTTYHWASITKTFTGIAIMQLRDRGLLSLDDPLVKYIPELSAVHDPYGPISAITIREAMSHSSGFRDATWPWRSEPWQPFEPTQWSQIVAMLPYTSIHFAPGSRFGYSNLAVVFLGEIIERLSGDPYEAYMEKNVLGPLRMYHSYFDRSPYTLVRYRSHSYDLQNGKLTEDPFNFDSGITRSNGGLNAPLPDMVKYLELLLGDPARQAEYDAILKRSSLKEMWKPILPVAPDADFPSRAGAHDFVAGSFFVHTDGKLRLVGKSGSQNGFLSNFYLDPNSRRAYIVIYNTDARDAPQNTHNFDTQLRDYLIDHYFSKESQ
ncbi:MAG: serine hydrolase domain-containing protein [Acidobacteriaceae bacterium]